ncbi:MAG: DUF5372 family protein [Bacteroidota bacterium]|nr:DUF5372 family protein [Bacteroidota bacterium]
MPQEATAKGDADTVTVTHPFHPQGGQVFRVAPDQWFRGVPMLRCYADAGTQFGLPVAWTNQREIDDFERVSAGRAPFRPDDLKCLRARVDALLNDQK